LQPASAPLKIILTGLETAPKQRSILPRTFFFDINFKPLGVEYILHTSIADLLNAAKEFENNSWSFNAEDLKDFDAFYNKASNKLNELLPMQIDERKRKLFELIYSSNGEMSVQEISEKVFWSSRQINRYFNEQFGISLKAYCNILRLGASFKHISEGKLFPEQNFTDQNHFIKEIKKYAGVTPKELSKNKDDRFIDITAIKKFPS